MRRDEARHRAGCRVGGHARGASELLKSGPYRCYHQRTTLSPAKSQSHAECHAFRSISLWAIYTHNSWSKVATKSYWLFFPPPPPPFSIVSAKEALEKCQSLMCNFKELRALLILTSEFRDSSQFLQNEAWVFFFLSRHMGLCGCG